MRISDILERDFFSIIDFCGEKSVHINGYFYTNGDSITGNEDEIYRFVEPCGLIVPIDEFIRNYKERGGEYLDNLYYEAKQYIEDMTEEEVLSTAENFYEGSCQILSYAGITEETPYGNYFDKGTF